MEAAGTHPKTASQLSCKKSDLLFILFIFTLFTVDLKLLIYRHLLYSLYSNNIEVIDVNSVTEQEMLSFPKEFLKSM